MGVERSNALKAAGFFFLAIFLIIAIDGGIVSFYTVAYQLTPEAALISSTKAVIIVNELIFILIAFLAAAKVFKWGPRDLGLTGKNLRLNILVGFGVGVLGFLAATALIYLISLIVSFEVPEWFVEMFRSKDLAGLAVLLTLTWGLIGPGEEAFFRGFLQEAMTRWLGPAKGIIIASVLFGLAHFSDVLWYRSLGGLLLGIIYGAVYYRTGSLVSVAIAHSLNDTIAFILTYLS